MTENPRRATLVDREQHPEIEYVIVEGSHNSGPFRKFGCGLMLLLWFGILLLPLLIFVLAIQGDITIYHNEQTPDRLQHPRFQIFVQMEPGVRGLQITRTVVKQLSDESMCLAVRVNYLMWEGRGDPAQYCDCYLRKTTESEWQFIGSTQGHCQPQAPSEQ